jgi:hypothetical protein
MTKQCTCGMDLQKLSRLGVKVKAVVKEAVASRGSDSQLQSLAMETTQHAHAVLFIVHL